MNDRTPFSAVEILWILLPDINKIPVDIQYLTG